MKDQHRRILVFLCCMMLIILFVSGCVDQKQNNTNETSIEYIRIQGKGEYRSIQQALDNASSFDKIIIPTGSYTGRIWINTSNIQLEGSGVELTHILGNKTGDVIKINADNTSIKDLSIKNSGNGVYDAGIYVHASNVTISKLGIEYCYHGIYLHQDTNNTRIRENIITHSHNGIYGIQSTNNTISNNVISDNRAYGMYIRFYSNFNQIINNQFNANDVGIRVKSSQYNHISQNEFRGHIDKGIYVCCGAENNLFYENAFIDNNVHAYDSLDNSWFFDMKGNYWDDYDGKDENNDDQGDDPYQIPGGVNTDNYPLLSRP